MGQKLKATEIRFRRAEGRTEECTTEIFRGDDCWEDVERHILRQRRTAPSQGYDKCDVVITFAVDASNPETNVPLHYATRYDMRSVEASGYSDTLANHVREDWRFRAALYTPSHLTYEQHARFLADMGIDPKLWERRCKLYDVPGLVVGR